MYEYAIYAVVLVIVAGLIYFLLRKCFRRIKSIEDLPTDYVGKNLSGKVTSVSDGDGFKFVHTPWFSSEDTFEDSELLIRLAGIDAPELGGPGKPTQPFALKSKQALGNLVLGEKVKIKLVGIDMYNRLLAMCFIKGWIFSVNVNMEMVKLGMAEVYKGKGACYDGCRNEFLNLENIARVKKLGIWSQGTNYVSPRKYKNIYRMNV